LRFPGQIYDSQAGLQQNMARNYDPAVARSSLWVTAEVNDWIANRTAGVPLELDEGSNSVPE
jgi:hypothetical protein